MSLAKYAIGAVVGVAATFGVLGARDYLWPSDPIVVVNQSTRPVRVAVPQGNRELGMVVPAGTTRSITAALAYADLGKPRSTAKALPTDR